MSFPGLHPAKNSKLLNLKCHMTIKRVFRNMSAKMLVTKGMLQLFIGNSHEFHTSWLTIIQTIRINFRTFYKFSVYKMVSKLLTINTLCLYLLIHNCYYSNLQVLYNQCIKYMGLHTNSTCYLVITYFQMLRNVIRDPNQSNCFLPFNKWIWKKSNLNITCILNG